MPTLARAESSETNPVRVTGPLRSSSRAAATYFRLANGFSLSTRIVRIDLLVIEKIFGVSAAVADNAFDTDAVLREPRERIFLRMRAP